MMSLGMVLANANVYTSDSGRPKANALVIEGGLITQIGDDRNPVDAKDLPIYDLGGRTVIAGLIDAHTHPSSVSQSFWHIRLPWTEDIDEILDFIRDYALAHPVEEAPFLYFEYYPSTTFAGSAPTKELLDSAVSDRPVLCQDFSDHEHWVNSRMLELMGITKTTPDPLPGLEMFVRDEDGEPTGLLRENVHRHFVDDMYKRIGWTPPHSLSAERVKPFFDFLTAHGVTAIFEALLEDEALLQAITELDERGELNVYYEGALRFRNAHELPAVINRLKILHAKYTSPHISLNTLKLFLDGTNETGNSAVLAPMCNHKADLGDIAMETDELVQSLLICNDENVDLHIHLVGDRAFRTACDAVQAAQDHLRNSLSTWRIQVTLAHCELVDPADMARPAELGIIVNWTAHWSGGYFGEESQAHLGLERWNRMYRFNEIAGSGACVTFGSDVVTAYELDRAKPLFGMQVAATRVDPQYPLDADRYPGSMRPQRDAVLSRELLLQGYTINAARQMRLGDKIGSLEVGKVANLGVLNTDLFEADSGSLGAIKFDAVIFDGQIVHGAL